MQYSEEFDETLLYIKAYFDTLKTNFIQKEIFCPKINGQSLLYTKYIKKKMKKRELILIQ